MMIGVRLLGQETEPSNGFHSKLNPEKTPVLAGAEGRDTITSLPAQLDHPSLQVEDGLPFENPIPPPNLGTEVLNNPVLNENEYPNFSSDSGAQSDGPVALFIWGPVIAHPRVGYGVTYNTGLRAGPGRPASSVVQTLSPGVTFELGQNWRLTYAPSLALHSSKAFRDSLNQSFSLMGHTQLGQWSVALSENYSYSDSVLVETGQQSQQNANATSVSANRSLTSAISLNLGLSQSIRSTRQFNSAYSWSNHDSLNYRFSELLTVGLLGGYTYDRIQPSGDMMSEQLRGTLKGSLGRKLTYGISGGLEFRQFVESKAPMLVSPLYSGNLDYRLTSTTSFSLTYEQIVNPSFYSDEVSISSGVNAILSQRVFGRFNVSLSAGHRSLDRRNTASPTSRQFSGNYTTLHASVSTHFLRRGNVSIFYGWNENSTSTLNQAFLNRQIGLNLSYGF